jgi:hypothetical protein
MMSSSIHTKPLEFIVRLLCAAGTTLTHLGPFGNAMQRQLDQALKELIAPCRSSITRYKYYVNQRIVQFRKDMLPVNPSYMELCIKDQIKS